MSTDRAAQRLADQATIRRYIEHVDLVRGLVDSLPGRTDPPDEAMAQLLSALTDVWRAEEDFVIRPEGWVLPAVRALVEAFDRAEGTTRTDQGRALCGVVQRLGGDPWLLAGLHPRRAHAAQLAAAMGRPWRQPGGSEIRDVAPYGVLRRASCEVC